MPELRHCSLFSGIGGFEVGLRDAGFEPVMICENDPGARAVLKRRFGDVQYRTTVDRLRNVPKCDVLTAGWPCQDLSQAGRTAGIDGSQSKLVGHVFRILEGAARKPRFVLLENVAFALHLQGGKAIKTVTAELETQGYRWAYRIFNSLEFGLPQRRRRVFILAALDVDPESVLFDGGGDAPTQTCSRYVGFYWTEGNRGVGWTPDAVPPLKGSSGLSIPSPPGIWDRRTHKFFSPGIRDAERLQGFAQGWTSPAAEKFGDRVRWKLVGNAVSVPISRWIGRRIRDASSGLLSCVPIIQTGDSHRHNMAWGGPGRAPSFSRVNLEGPQRPRRKSLSAFGFMDSVPLSMRAATGFLERLVASPLIVERDFLVDLAEYCERPDLIQRRLAA